MNNIIRLLIFSAALSPIGQASWNTSSKDWHTQEAQRFAADFYGQNNLITEEGKKSVRGTFAKKILIKEANMKTLQSLLFPLLLKNENNKDQITKIYQYEQDKLDALKHASVLFNSTQGLEEPEKVGQGLRKDYPIQISEGALLQSKINELTHMAKSYKRGGLDNRNTLVSSSSPIKVLDENRAKEDSNKYKQRYTNILSKIEGLNLELMALPEENWESVAQSNLGDAIKYLQEKLHSHNIRKLFEIVNLYGTLSLLNIKVIPDPALEETHTLLAEIKANDYVGMCKSTVLKNYKEAPMSDIKDLTEKFKKDIGALLGISSSAVYMNRLEERLKKYIRRVEPILPTLAKYQDAPENLVSIFLKDNSEIHEGTQLHIKELMPQNSSDFHTFFNNQISLLYGQSIQESGENYNLKRILQESKNPQLKENTLLSIVYWMLLSEQLKTYEFNPHLKVLDLMKPEEGPQLTPSLLARAFANKAYEGLKATEEGQKLIQHLALESYVLAAFKVEK